MYADHVVEAIKYLLSMKIEKNLTTAINRPWIVFLFDKISNKYIFFIQLYNFALKLIFLNVRQKCVNLKYKCYGNAKCLKLLINNCITLIFFGIPQYHSTLNVVNCEIIWFSNSFKLYDSSLNSLQSIIIKILLTHMHI